MFHKLSDVSFYDINFAPTAPQHGLYGPQNGCRDLVCLPIKILFKWNSSTLIWWVCDFISIHVGASIPAFCFLSILRTEKGIYIK